MSHRAPERRRTMRSPSTAKVEDLSSASFRSGGQGTRSHGTSLVGGLRMAQAFAHEPVMVEEVVDLFDPVPPGVVVDATVGGGGHAAALLAAHRDLGVLGLDRDPAAVAACLARLAQFGPRAQVRHARFANLQAELDVARSGPGTWPASGAGDPTLSGVLFDLGVSSPQLDQAERGFSYRRLAPLDMRMDPTAGQTAADLVNRSSVEELASMFAASGERRLARRIARAIVAARPVATTDDLAKLVAAAVPAPGRRRGHPARRVFQALRIAINDEMPELVAGLPAALRSVDLGGRLVVISYHSGEDQMVKATMVEAVTGGCTCPPALPCVCGARAEFRLVFRGARKPSASELARNHRAESARLRAVERTRIMTEEDSR